MNAVALSITSPEILVGDIHFHGAVPEVTEKLTSLGHQLTGHNFDLREVNTRIHDATAEIFAEAGYLDSTHEAPVFAAPRADLASYVVDVDVKLNPGPLYHIGTITMHPEGPVTDAELGAALPFKTGDPASVAGVRDAVTALARVYAEHAYLQTKASCNIAKNASNHTVAYSFNFVSGPQFRLAGVDTSGLPTDLQQAFASLWHVQPGALVDKDLQLNLRDTLEKLHTRSTIAVFAQRDTAENSVVLVLRVHKLPGSIEPGDPGTPIPSSLPPPQPPIQLPQPPIGPGRRRP